MGYARSCFIVACRSIRMFSLYGIWPLANDTWITSRVSPLGAGVEAATHLGHFLVALTFSRRRLIHQQKAVAPYVNSRTEHMVVGVSTMSCFRFRTQEDIEQFCVMTLLLTGPHQGRQGCVSGPESTSDVFCQTAADRTVSTSTAPYLFTSEGRYIFFGPYLSTDMILCF